jgi:hypothetical protein
MECGVPMVKISIENRTGAHLILERSDLSWGQFRGDAAKDIPPKNMVEAFEVRAVGLNPKIVTGTVIYQLQDDPNSSIRIAFDIEDRPDFPTQVVAKSSNPDIAATVVPSSVQGIDVNCTVKISDGP